MTKKCSGGESCAVVVGNYSPELEKLKGFRKIFFATKQNAGGILEAIEHYDFIKKAVAAKTRVEC